MNITIECFRLSSILSTVYFDIHKENSHIPG
jgi:hypothetical protein